MEERPDSSPDRKPGISILSILVLSLFFGLIVGAGSDKSHILPVALISAVILYFNRDKIAASDVKKNAPSHAKPAQSHYAWPEPGQFACAVSAEPYQKVIEQLVQENSIRFETATASQSHDFKVELIPDASNPFDTDVVRVEIHNHTIGHFSRQQAHSFRHKLREKELEDQITTCRSVLTKHGETDDKKPGYGVRLDIEALE
ncbi:hypothetical protein [Nitrosomonas oligotropha]|uniref:hypothetical protein n=1 Tax=Nitrosomonas oligotropha TaxID=42354 RepID=UPI00137108B8|nr:hypothetical protein [Nitrosomonas oligotropha]MXS81972.1 hypothetical protein [Nitrosomonas oligotropha]